MDTCTNLHFTQSNASFGRLDVANLNKNNSGLPSLSQLIFNPLKNWAKLQWLSQVMLLCFQILSQLIFFGKVRKENSWQMFSSLPTFQWWHVRQINSPRQKCHKFPIIFPSQFSVVGAVGVFVCISPVCHSSTQLCFLYSQLSEGNCCLCPMSMLGAMRWQRRYRYIGRYRYIDI